MFSINPSPLDLFLLSSGVGRVGKHCGPVAQLVSLYYRIKHVPGKICVASRRTPCVALMRSAVVYFIQAVPRGRGNAVMDAAYSTCDAMPSAVVRLA